MLDARVLRNHRKWKSSSLEIILGRRPDNRWNPKSSYSLYNSTSHAYKQQIPGKRYFFLLLTKLLQSNQFTNRAINNILGTIVQFLWIQTLQTFLRNSSKNKFIPSSKNIIYSPIDNMVLEVHTWCDCWVDFQHLRCFKQRCLTFYIFLFGRSFQYCKS